MRNLYKWAIVCILCQLVIKSDCCEMCQLSKWPKMFSLGLFFQNFKISDFLLLKMDFFTQNLCILRKRKTLLSIDHKASTLIWITIVRSFMKLSQSKICNRITNNVSTFLIIEYLIFMNMHFPMLFLINWRLVWNITFTFHLMALLHIYQMQFEKVPIQ